MICVDQWIGAPYCLIQCGACTELDAPRWHHHPGAAVAHILASDGVAGLCGAHQPGRYPEPWQPGTGGLTACETCRAKSGAVA